MLAAFQGKIKKVIIPKENEPHLSEIPDNIKTKLDIITVETIEQVFNIALKKKINKKRKK
mgnify:CR=1 FL=1